MNLSSTYTSSVPLHQTVVDFFPHLSSFLQNVIGLRIGQSKCYESRIEWEFPFPSLVKASLLSSLLGSKHSMEDNNNNILIRNAYLLPHQLLGISIGLYGFFKLRQHLANNNNHHHIKRYSSIAYSYLFFAFMNLTSIFAHTFFERKTFGWQWFGALDVAFTGSSSLCLALASIERLTNKFDVPLSVDDSSKNNGNGMFIMKIHPWYHACDLFFITVVGQVLGIPWINEMVYIALACIGGLCTLFWMISEWKSKDNEENEENEKKKSNMTKMKTTYICTSILGLFLALTAVSLNPFYCDWFGNVFTMMEALFCGCNIVFLSLFPVFLSSSLYIY